MSVSQNLLALFSPEPARLSLSARMPQSQPGAETEGAQSFAEMLSGQQPEKLEALLTFLGEADVEAGLEAMQSAIQGAELAVDGKDLPPGIQAWLSQLSALEEADPSSSEPVSGPAVDPDALAELVGDWAEWLAQARSSLVEQAETETETDNDAVAIPGSASTTTAAEWLPKAATESRSPGLALADRLAQTSAPGNAVQQQIQGSAATEGEESVDLPLQTRERTERAGNAEGQTPTNLRNLETTQPVADARAALSARMVDNAESPNAKRTPSEADAAEALLRPGTQAQASAQGALATRPVLAAAQPFGVPFGQAGWGEALIEKINWMSSQNLRSVEIRLDPAELGPLEIHVQTRGQEHQVQFVSQNPSVREALEAQMFRLRESFSQQGMDLVDVSVGDSAVGQQARHDAEGEGSSGRDGEKGGLQSSQADETAMLMAAGTASQAVSARLVDYYA